MDVALTFACPKCQETKVGTVERTTGISYVEGIDDDGRIVYTGVTDYDDDMETVTENGHPIFRCAYCGHEWCVQEVVI